MTKFATLIQVLTAEQVASAKKGYMVYMDNLAQCKKVEALGYKLEQELGTKIAKYRYLDMPFMDSIEFEKYLNKHGAAVKVISMVEKYSDNNGAYEVLTVADQDGNEWSESNMYDSSACFRHMSEQERIDYANKVG